MLRRKQYYAFFFAFFYEMNDAANACAKYFLNVLVASR